MCPWPKTAVEVLKIKIFVFPMAKSCHSIPSCFALTHVHNGLVASIFFPDYGIQHGGSSLGKVASLDETQTCTEKVKSRCWHNSPTWWIDSTVPKFRGLWQKKKSLAQKFSRIGAREFVPFAEYEDLTELANIKLVCEKYFSSTVGKSVVCDVLAGEQGPSCSTLEQVPDLRH